MNMDFDDATNISRICHFYELGWEDPDMKKQIFNETKGDYATAGPCPFPSHLDYLNITRIPLNEEAFEQLVYHPKKYFEVEPPYQIYIPHPYLVRKMIYVFATFSEQCDPEIIYGGQLDAVLGKFGIMVPPDPVKVDQECKQKLREIFESIDTNGDGYLSPEELTFAMKTLHDPKGRKLSKDYVENMIKHFDEDGDGKISFHEFTDKFFHFQHAKHESSTFDEV